MKSLRLGIWMILMNFGLFSGAVKAMDICDELQKINSDFGRLDVLLVGIEDKIEDLQNKVQELKDEEGKAREARRQEIDDLAADRQRISQGIAGREADLAKKKSELAAIADTQALQAEVDEASQEIWKAEEVLENIKALDREKFASDPDLSAKRRDLEIKRAEFNRLFPPPQKPEAVINALQAQELHPMFAGTRLDDIHRAISRRGESYVWRGPAIDPSFGAELDGLSLAELDTRKDEERKRLIGLAERVRNLPGEIEEREKEILKKLDESEKALWAKREQMERDKKAATEKLNEATTAQREAPAKAKRLEKEIGETEETLKDLREELGEVNRKLAETDRLEGAVKAAEAELSGLQAEEARIGNELARLAQRRSELETEIGKERERLHGEVDKLVSEGRRSSNRAQRAQRQNDAEACRDFLVAAMVSFNAASNLAMEKQGCLGPSPFAKVEADIQTARKIQCAGPAQQTELIEVPNVAQGSTREDAALTLSRAGFSNIFFSEQREPKNCADKGKVIRLISPGPGEKKPPETQIMVATYNKDCVEQADTGGSAAQAPGGGWDAAADKAQVSAKTISTDMSKPPMGGPSPSSGSQVDQANEVAKEAIAGGPQDKPVLNPDVLVGALGTAAGIAGAVQGGSRGTGPVPSPSLTRVPGSPLPGVNSPMGTPSRIGSGLPGSGIEDRRSSPACEPYFQKLKRLRQTQEQLVMKAAAHSRDATSAPARQNACRLAENSEEIIQTINAAKSAGCSTQASPEALSYQLKQWKALCSGGR